ncbi:MAG: response regulator [Ktedonobacterales bacterium]
MARVLVVDDEDSIRGALRMVLEDDGHTVLEAANGMEALHVLRASADPTVVVLDLMMPVLDGSGVLGAVAADHKLIGRHVFVLMTAAQRTMPLAFANLLTSLEVPVLSKPFDLQDVLSMVARAAGRLNSGTGGKARSRDRREP